MDKREDLVLKQIKDLILDADLTNVSTDYLKPISKSRNYKTDLQYNGMNAFLLALVSSTKNLPNVWLTFNQAKELGAKIKKGSKSVKIKHVKRVYYIEENKKRTYIKLEDLEKYQDKEFDYYISIKYYNVFNYSCFDGLPLLENEDLKVNKVIEDIPLNTYKKEIKIEQTQGGIACYSPSNDTVYMPKSNLFLDNLKEYSVLFHELGHATGHESRLHRDLNGKFGSINYAYEELIAEFTASLMALEHGFFYLCKDSNAKYIKSWFSKLNEDSQLNQAFSEALKSKNYLTSLN